MRYLKKSSVSRYGIPVMLASAAAFALAGCGSSSPSGNGSATAKSVLAAAKTAIAKQTSAHLAVTVKEGSNTQAETITEDAGQKTGIETITQGAAKVTIEVTASYGYIDGTPTGFTKIFGMTSAEEKKIGKNWVSFKAGTSEYSDLESGVTMSSLSSVLPKAKGTKLATKTEDGAKVHVLTWTTAATSSTPKLLTTLYIPVSGTQLPKKETATSTSGTDETIELSSWGESISIKVPPAKSTISYTKISSS